MKVTYHQYWRNTKERTLITTVGYANTFDARIAVSHGFG